MLGLIKSSLGTYVVGGGHGFPLPAGPADFVKDVFFIYKSKDYLKIDQGERYRRYVPFNKPISYAAGSLSSYRMTSYTFKNLDSEASSTPGSGAVSSMGKSVSAYVFEHGSTSQTVS